MVEFLRAGLLETERLRSGLRIDPGHHVLDRTILPGGVHGLKDQQERIPVVGVETYPAGRLIF